MGLSILRVLHANSSFTIKDDPSGQSFTLNSQVWPKDNY